MQTIHTLPVLVSVSCLAFVSALCLIAVLSNAVKDNLVERIGLAMLCFSCLGRMFNVWEAGLVPDYSLFIHISLALLFAGSGWAKFRNHLRNKKNHVPDATL